MIEIDILKKHSLSSVWKYEDADFTPWLTKNINVLSKVLNLPLLNAKSEQHTENFYVDIVASTGLGEDNVVIENQYNASDHDHLGKLITYAAFFKAKYAIWIAEKMRPEHILAINELNKSESTGFFAIEASVMKIGDSKPALNLDVLASPQIAAFQYQGTKKVLYDFWSLFLSECASQTNLKIKRKPSVDSWMDFSSGKSDVYFNVFTNKNRMRVSLVFNNKSKEINEKNYEKFLLAKNDIEKQLGELTWESSPNEKRTVFITKEFTDGGYGSPTEIWQAIISKVVTYYEKFVTTLKPMIK